MGSKKSSTSTNTTNEYFDQRSVVDASGGGIAGSRNNVDSNNRYSADSYTSTLDASQQFTDSSDRSTRTTVDASQRNQFDASQQFTDNSDRSSRTTVDASQRFDDSSNRSVQIDNRTTTTTDGGAFGVVSNVVDGIMQFGMAQTDLARDLAGRADSFRAGATDFAVKAQELAIGFSDDQANRAFDLARSSAAQAFNSSAEAIGFTRETFAQTMELVGDAMSQAGMQAGAAADTAGAAYASATSTASGNKTLIYAAIGAVALVGVAVALRKG